MVNNKPKQIEPIDSLVSLNQQLLSPTFTSSALLFVCIIIASLMQARPGPIDALHRTSVLTIAKSYYMYIHYMYMYVYSISALTVVIDCTP